MPLLALKTAQGRSQARVGGYRPEGPPCGRTPARGSRSWRRRGGRCAFPGHAELANDLTGTGTPQRGWYVLPPAIVQDRFLVFLEKEKAALGTEQSMMKSGPQISSWLGTYTITGKKCPAFRPN